MLLLSLVQVFDSCDHEMTFEHVICIFYSIMKMQIKNKETERERHREREKEGQREGGGRGRVRGRVTYMYNPTLSAVRQGGGRPTGG